MASKDNGSLSLRARARSIARALSGLGHVVRTQRNAQIHLVATAAVVAVGLSLGLSASQWALLVLAMAAVWAAEAFNTALELLADAVSPERHPLVGKAKDVAAGAVLVTAIGAATVGLLVFVPQAIERFGG